MPKVDIAPGLTVDDDHYELAADAITQHAPEFGPLSYSLWTSNRWTLIPDENTGRPYKAQLILDEDAARQTIVSLWFEPDLRGGEKSKPHRHPFDFHSIVLDGRLVEDRYLLNDGLVVRTPAIEYKASDVNRIGREVYHEIVDVEPGETLTLMLCGPGMNNWGTLDPDTGLVTPNVKTARFAELIRDLNPHQKRA